MELYLQECKHNLKNASESSKIQIVLGNESCDLDSAISSLVMAYFIFKVQKTADIVIPVLNVKRKELAVRTEVVFFLEETSINISDVICIDEIDLKALHEKGKLSLVLVDHNSLSVEQSYLDSRVVQVFDHHEIDNPDKLKKMNAKVEPVGSCCTLVAEEIFNSSVSIMDPQVAMLLYGTILLDTICLNETAQRVTEKDRKIIAKLETILEGVNRNEVFETLQKVKFDVSKLTPVQLLYKDTKLISDNSTSIALISYPGLLQDVLQEESFRSALEEMASSKNLNSIILLGMKVAEGQSIVRRQIAAYDKNPSSLEKISKYLQKLENPSLGLRQLPLCGYPLTLFEQENIALTRKFVLPAMQNYLKIDLSDHSELNNSCDNRNENNSKTEEVDNYIVEFPEDVIPTYQAEPLDFPDSPDHSKLLGMPFQSPMSGQVSLISEPDEVEFKIGEATPEGTGTLKRIAVHPKVLESEYVEDDQRSLSSLSNRSDAFSQSEDIILDDDAATIDDLDNSDCDSDLDSPISDRIPEMSAAEEFEEERSWKTCTVNGEDKKIDMKVIEPYRKVLSHGGYQNSSGHAIIIFSACYLPDRSRKDYEYVMDNLFLYVITTLDELVADDYILVYLHGATERSNMPSFGWLKRCYQMIDRRLRKNLKGLYLVHPTFWLKTIVIMTRPFISSKFTRKLKFVYNLKELSNLIPLDYVCIPDKVKQFDEDTFPD
ncbi:protein prune homolog 2-like isoform X2 [Argiope bruennichi]|uniref:Protein prune like protein n=1 Tax=Argiope bruennichi TaxID=94029 RepID=A0A8T0FBU5_ARGBR|nr:protein prune homolog 2-like isoform X2 [Argiope bruennichi]KAF8786403.1 Protein prune like protein [Argiope bruennichi]